MSYGTDLETELLENTSQRLLPYTTTEPVLKACPRYRQRTSQNYCATKEGAGMMKQDIALLHDEAILCTPRMMSNTDDEATVTAPKPLLVLKASTAS
ncbi:hypothetical protein TgHK011_002317 [Trichoderma gracile]|nr:hypothetical protein TgHK011_002317 [Trichoderma gracile]